MIFHWSSIHRLRESVLKLPVKTVYSGMTTPHTHAETLEVCVIGVYDAKYSKFIIIREANL